MVWVWLTACGWFSSSESEVVPPVVGASIGGVAPRQAPAAPPEAVPLTAEQLAQLDELFVRSTELVREGAPGAFERATITFVQATLEESHPGRGEQVTVVPATEGLEPRILKVTEVAEAELFVQLTTTSTADPGWLEAEAPEGARPEMLGRATVLHPVVPDASRGAVPADLPEGLTASTMVAGVDLSDDGVADIVTSEHCCDDVTLAPSDACGEACVVTYARTTDGWRVCEEG
ncbi:MAG: hypothetical protein AAF602_22290 [Myxococcota bacterium]